MTARDCKTRLCGWADCEMSFRGTLRKVPVNITFHRWSQDWEMNAWVFCKVQCHEGPSVSLAKWRGLLSLIHTCCQCCHWLPLCGTWQAFAEAVCCLPSHHCVSGLCNHFLTLTKGFSEPFKQPVDSFYVGLLHYTKSVFKNCHWARIHDKCVCVCVCAYETKLSSEVISSDIKASFLN